MAPLVGQRLRLGSAALLLWACGGRAAAAGPGEIGTCSADPNSQDESCIKRALEESIVELDGIHQDIKKLCPLYSTPVARWLLNMYSYMPLTNTLPQLLGLWPANISSKGWADDYFIVNYLLVGRISLGMYKRRTASWVYVPIGQQDVDDVMHVENIHAPHSDVDASPNFFPFESVIPGPLKRHFYVPLVTCFYSALRRLSTDTKLLNGTFFDDLDDPNSNTWDVVLKYSKYKKPVDWVFAFYDKATSWDGVPLWPTQMTDFSTYWKQDMWDDKLEYAIAFHLIGTHRLEYGSWDFKDVPGFETATFPYRLPLNVFNGFEVRKGFARYGVDMYFNSDGLPVVLQTPSGELVKRGDKTWQYWKFVWRSTLVTGITLVDHLHLTHFRAGNILARSSRVALPPTHPARRLLSIFTFGTIFVNTQAMHQLIGPRHMLHRSVPFKDFEKIQRTVPDAQAGVLTDIPDVPAIARLLNETLFKQLPQKLQQSPFYADGLLLIKAIRKLTMRWVEVKDVFCDASGQAQPAVLNFSRELIQEAQQGTYAIRDMGLYKKLQETHSCDIYKKYILPIRLVSFLFTVTGWHRQVGFVGDYYKDPSLATFSWKEGELSARPKQHMIMTIINVFTSTRQPLLKEDYTHLFKGMVPDLEQEYSAGWRDFQKDLKDIEDEIDRRNAKREIFNINMSPKIVESAVSK